MNQSVYLVNQEGSNICKIGIAKRIDARITQLQIANPQNLTLLASVPSPIPNRLESTLHRHFNQFKVKGEWFNLPSNEIQVFKKTCKSFHKRMFLELLYLTSLNADFENIAKTTGYNIEQVKRLHNFLYPHSKQ